MTPLTILVTGANKGVGYGICQTLLTASSLPRHSTIYLTARNTALGEKALSELRKMHSPSASRLVFQPLDIASQTSIDAAYELVRDRHGRLDVLVNNAGVELDSVQDRKPVEACEQEVAINYYGTLNMCQKFFPLIPAGTGRIVVVSSIACHLDKFGAAIRHEFQRADLRIDELSGMMERFLDAVRRGTSRDEGWARGYSTTKAADTALAAVLARDNPGTLINACCPGWVNTDMGRHVGQNAPKTWEEGARIPCRLAVDDIGGVSGRFWENPSLTDTGYGRVSPW